MDAQKKTDDSSLGLSVEQILMGVLSLEQGKSKMACNLIMAGLQEVDALNKKNGKPTKLVESFRKTKAKIERVKKMKNQNFTLTADGKIDMDRNSEFKVAEFIATVVAEKLGRPVEEVASSGYSQDDCIKLGPDAGVAYMDTRTGTVRLREPLQIEVGWFDPACQRNVHDLQSPFMKAVGELFPGTYTEGYRSFVGVDFYAPGGQYPVLVGGYNKKTGKFFRLQRTVETGYEDTRSYEQKKSDLMSGWSGNQQIAKSRGGFGRGQNYISGNFYNPCSRCVVAIGTSPEVINQRFYESWLGEVGQLDQHPYSGHEMAPVEILKKLAACQTADHVAEIVRLHWEELFTNSGMFEDEVGTIYARLRL